MGWTFGYLTFPAVNPFDTAGVAVYVSYTKGVSYLLLALLAGATYYLRRYKYSLAAGTALMVWGVASAIVLFYQVRMAALYHLISEMKREIRELQGKGEEGKCAKVSMVLEGCS